MFALNIYSTASWQFVLRGIGGLAPPSDNASNDEVDEKDYRASLLSNPNHNWDRRFTQGPLDLGFDSSFISILGVQDPPYAFFKDDVLQTKTGSYDTRSNINRECSYVNSNTGNYRKEMRIWEAGTYYYSTGLSKINNKHAGGGE